MTVLGGCPRIGILVIIEKLSKNKHSHITDIASIIFYNSEDFGQKAILGQALRIVWRAEISKRPPEPVS
jgi:hypothetical protein